MTSSISPAEFSCDLAEQLLAKRPWRPIVEGAHVEAIAAGFRERIALMRSSSVLGWSDCAQRSYDRGVLGRLQDGTPYFSPLGELVVDHDDDRVQCHLCGLWFGQLGSMHLPRAHGVTAEQYRELVGLLPRHPLWAPSLIAAQAARYRARLPHDERLRAGMRKGAALAKSGDLQREARVLLATRPVSLERARQLEQSSSVLGKRRAERYRARRGARAQELGFDDLTTYYRNRYGDDRLRVDELADELRCSQSAVRGDLQRLGLGPDRSRSHGARWRIGT